MDVRVLLRMFQSLMDNDATVVALKHDMGMIRNAGYIIDMGPRGGENGGRVIATGTQTDIAVCKENETGKYLKPLI